MKFAHMADCHIGAWRDPKLKQLNTEAFLQAVKICVNDKVDFILISGDLFNTALPGIDRLKEVVRCFKELKDKGIPVYLIPGSHDFSPSGKTMLDVLEEAGLCVNVVKGHVIKGKLRLRFVVDKKTGAKITGMIGRRGMLERSYYEELDRTHLEAEEGFKIFMFHTSITELKPKELVKMQSSPISLLPRRFNYYAGGHVHIVEKIDLLGYKNVVYPGPLFPNTFYELEELKKGGFYIYEDGRIIRKDIKIKEVITINVDANHKTPELITSEILSNKIDTNDKLILIRLKGVMESGKVSEIDFNRIYTEFKDAYFIMRNTTGLSTKEFEEIKIESISARDIENSLIQEHAGQFGLWNPDKDKEIIVKLMNVLSSERREGEKVYEFEERIKQELGQLLELD